MSHTLGRRERPDGVGGVAGRRGCVPGAGDRLARVTGLLGAAHDHGATLPDELLELGQTCLEQREAVLKLEGDVGPERAHELAELGDEAVMVGTLHAPPCARTCARCA